MIDETTLANFFSDVWSEIEHIIDTEPLTDRDYAKLLILGAIQNKASVFGIDRNVLGIPAEDADILFIRGVEKK